MRIIYKFTLIASLIGFTNAFAGVLESPTKQGARTQLNAGFGGYPHNGHAHSGYDIRNHGRTYAAISGTIQIVGGSVNRIRIIPKGPSRIKSVDYLHMKSFNVSNGQQVIQGQDIGQAGGVGAGGSIHTHIEVIEIKGASTVRWALTKDGKKPFPLGVPSIFGSGTAYVDPYPYFGVGFPFAKWCANSVFVEGCKRWNKLNFNTTKDEYEYLYGNTGVIAGESIEAAMENASATGDPNTQDVDAVAQFLSDQDGTTYGSNASAFVYDEDVSSQERLIGAARHRFYSEDWAKSITSISSRALYADYVAASGLESYIQQEIYRKKEHIEALLAVYTAQQIKAGKGTREANRLARQNGIESAIK